MNSLFPRKRIDDARTQKYMLDELCHGSSLDEVVGFKVFVTNISTKTGAPFEDVAKKIIVGVEDDLDQHRPEVEAIAAALMARGELKTNTLTR
jgi:hypothetical protein